MSRCYHIGQCRYMIKHFIYYMLGNKYTLYIFKILIFKHLLSLDLVLFLKDGNITENKTENKVFA